MRLLGLPAFPLYKLYYLLFIANTVRDIVEPNETENRVNQVKRNNKTRRLPQLTARSSDGTFSPLAQWSTCIGRGRDNIGLRAHSRLAPQSFYYLSLCRTSVYLGILKCRNACYDHLDLRFG